MNVQYVDPAHLAQWLEGIKEKKILILGATGQVGRRLVSILSFSNFPIQNLTLVARETRKVSYGVKTIEVQEMDKTDLSDFDLVFSCLPAEVIRECISSIWNERCIIVDKSSAFRNAQDVPLVVPEVNGELSVGQRLISSPNCVAIPLSMTLHALLPVIDDIQHVAVSTYQSVSGAGDKAMQALINETQETFLYNPKVMPQYFERQIVFNIIPKIGEFDEVFSTSEENKIRDETNIILNRKLPISVIAARVPVMIGHSIALHIACKFKDIRTVEAALEAANGLTYMQEGRYVCAPEVVNEDYVYVSRLKRTDTGLCMWITTDNLHKGAALNALQIALTSMQETDAVAPKSLKY